MNDIIDILGDGAKLVRGVWQSLLAVLVVLAVGYPAALVAQHGFKPHLWPPEAEAPAKFWISSVRSGGEHLADVYMAMALGRSPGFQGGGTVEFLVIVAVIVVMALALHPRASRIDPQRDQRGTYGDARFAERRERAQMRAGLELGIDPESGRPIRVAVKGNLLTIAPPRMGKSTGLLIPNLVAPERAGWFGPAVVIDPKGEAYQSTADRRRQLGRKVICLDPIGLVGGVDTWNPMEGLNPGNILYLQRLARALMPESVSNENRYFQERAVDTIVAGFLAAYRESRPTPLRVLQLLANTSHFVTALRGVDEEPARKTRALLEMDAKTRDPILSTAMQAFQWNDDRRLQTLTARSTFDIKEVCRGEADLFVVLPTEDLGGLSPFIRWFLTDLFAAIRRSKPTERVVIFVDEARVLGRFGEIVVASGELPGYNASLWTFWQDRSQIISVYGEADARTMLATAEFITVSDPAMIDPQEREHWSQALGDYTILEETTNTESASGDKPGRTSKSVTAKAVRLLPPEALTRLDTAQLLIFPNSPLYAKRPLQVRKTRYDDARLSGLTKSLGGTASA